jgi:hypothetical protein
MMRHGSFNAFDGDQVADNLLAHPDLWIACWWGDHMMSLRSIASIPRDGILYGDSIYLLTTQEKWEQLVEFALLQRGVAVWNNPCGGKTPMRESRFVRIAKLAYHIAQQTLPTYAHPKSRHDYTCPQRVACVRLKIYRNDTYRDQ